jgi:OFA family oxalate/formate antiporter-like MFS transporter
MTSSGTSSYRWLQLVLGIISMIMIANLQYGWTLFVGPINKQFGWTTASIQVAFSLFVLAETWLVPFEGYLVDRFGPKLLVFIGGILVGLAWTVDSIANTLSMLYLGGVLAGIGGGIVYGTCVGNALKWFRDRRGLAAGLTAAGYGAGAALTVIPIYNTIQGSGYQAAFLYFGLGQGLIILLAALFLRAPKPGEAAEEPKSRALIQTTRDYTPLEAVKTAPFWLMYLMFTMVAMGGLMFAAQLGPMATAYNVSKAPVNILGITLVALPFALALNNIMNGICRPFFGWVSDHIGRENTMTIAFTAEGCAVLLLILFASNPVLFILFAGLSFFAWGEIFSLFPATIGDLFGRQYVTTNYGLLYTAKGMASLLVPVGSLVYASTHSWVPVFLVMVAFDFINAILALFVLKPLRIRRMESSLAGPGSAGLRPSVAGGSE